MKTIAFVIPWYAENIPGGAETALRGLVHHLADSGMKLEILTTCVKEFQSDWGTNFYKEGLEDCAGIPVRRFKADKRNKRAFDEVAIQLINGNQVTPEEEEIFQREMVNSTKLCQYIREHRDDYALFVFIPYMFGPIYHGVQECPDKSVMIPCFHDEAYIYMKNFQKPFSSVRGMIFNSEPERLLAERVYGVKGENFVTLGQGIDTDMVGDAARFREKYRIREPFILYAGRKDAGKKVDVLIDYFMQYKRRNTTELKLVLLGGGDIAIPSDDVIDLGYVPLQDKHDAYAAATLFCNPSQFESFSIVIMESWLAKRPVIVNAECGVTTDFVRRVGGGLYYADQAEFEGCIRYLITNAETADAMGENGREYVLNTFSWDVIVKNYTGYFERVSRQAEGGAS